MGDLLELMNIQPAGGGVSGDGRSLQSGHLQSGGALRPDDTGAAEAVQICQLFHQMEQQQQLMGGGGGALPVDAAAMAASLPQHGSGPSSRSLYAPQAAGVGGVSIQRLPVQLVQAAGGLPAVVASHAPLPQQQLLQQQAQQYLSATLPSMSTQSGAGGAHSGLYPTGSHSLLQAAPSITVTTSAAVSAKDAAAAARAARQRKRKEMAAEKAALEAAAAASGGALLMLPTPSVQLATAPSEGEEGGTGALGGTMAVGSGEVSFGGEAVTGGGTALDSGEAGSDERQQKRMIKNRESAARSRARRQEYTASLEQQVASLREQNRDLRVRVVLAAAAPADPHAGKLDGQLLRRTRTTPL